jgi:hypothetical protein
LSDETSELLSNLNLPSYTPLDKDFEDKILDLYFHDLFLERYRTYLPPAHSKVILFSAIKHPSFSDFIFIQRFSKLLLLAIPDLDLEVIFLTGEKISPLKIESCCPFLPIYVPDFSNLSLSEKVKSKLGQAALVIECFGKNDSLNDFFNTLKSSFCPLPSRLMLEFNSNEFNSDATSFSMGFHDCARGLLFLNDVTFYEKKNLSYYLANLVSGRGAITFIYMLLGLRENQGEDIEIQTFDIQPFISALELADFSKFDIREIRLRYKDEENTIFLKRKGQRILIKEIENLSMKEIETLELNSKNIFAIKDLYELADGICFMKLLFMEEDTPILSDLLFALKKIDLELPLISSYFLALQDSDLSAYEKANKLNQIIDTLPFTKEMDYFLHYLKENYFLAAKFINYFKQKAYLYFHPEEREIEELLFKQFREGAHSLQDLFTHPLKSSVGQPL